MILGPRDYSLVGSQGAALVVYKLRRMGLHAVEVGEGMPFDVLAFSDNRVIRIQAKATQAAKNGKFRFMTAKGRYAVATKHSADLTEYTDREVDLIALVALPLNTVFFKPVSEVGKTKTTVSERKFKREGIDGISFNEAVEKVFGKAHSFAT